MKPYVSALLLVPFAVAAAFGGSRPDWAFLAPSPVQPNVVLQRQPLSVPGSKRHFTMAQINDLVDTIDWFPNAHPRMPRAVAHGRAGAMACAACHLTSGMGHPESARLAGLSKGYLEQQLEDFRSGVRHDPADRMNGIAKALSADDLDATSRWFANLRPRPWIKVVPATTVPKSYINGASMRVPLPGHSTEPLGERIIELPQAASLAVRRDPRSGFIAYVPVGSAARGKRLVTTGDGKVQPCTMCHGADLKGQGDIPAIAGDSTLYIGRELWLFQTGARGGPLAAQMKPVAAALSPRDIIDAAAYVAGLPP